MVFRSVLKFAISIGCIVAVWGYLEYDRDASAERLAEAMKLRSIRVLRGADSKEELTAAVGELGVVIPLPDEEFVAIRYRDVHGNPNVSTAVAKDSGGKWWHFRSTFACLPPSSSLISNLCNRGPCVNGNLGGGLKVHPMNGSECQAPHRYCKSLNKRVNP